MPDLDDRTELFFTDGARQCASMPAHGRSALAAWHFDSRSVSGDERQQSIASLPQLTSDWIVRIAGIEERCALDEPWNEGQPFRGDVKTHIMRHLEGWTEPLPTLVRATDFERNTFRWEIYNRRPLQQWSHGRVSFLGDAVHPVSPYAAYGMGMAIEDGFYLAKSLAGADLADRDVLAAALAKYEAQRVDYTNKQAIFARYLGYLFHRLPWPLRTVRDAVFDHTRFLERMLVKNYLRDAETQMVALEL